MTRTQRTRRARTAHRTGGADDEVTATPSVPIPVVLVQDEDEGAVWRITADGGVRIDPFGDGRRYRAAWVTRQGDDVVVGLIRQTGDDRDHRAAVHGEVPVDRLGESRDGRVRRLAMDIAAAWWRRGAPTV